MTVFLSLQDLLSAITIWTCCFVILCYLRSTLDFPFSIRKFVSF